VLELAETSENADALSTATTMKLSSMGIPLATDTVAFSPLPLFS
jgi:hypothetical protein